jgi:hypothetical protein
MTPDSTVPSDTDRLADPIVEHGKQMAAVPDEAADIASKLVEQVVSGHLDAALEAVERGDGAFEDYSPHPISIEGDARAIVAAVTPILLAQLQGRLDTAEGQLAAVRENQLGLARGFLHDAAAQRQRSGGDWRDPTLKRAEGTTHGAVSALQVLLVLTGEVEYDEEADAVWDLVSRKDDSAALGLGEGDGQ